MNKSGRDIGMTRDLGFAEVRERDWPNVVTVH